MQNADLSSYLERYQQQGYVVVPGLFTAEEVAVYRQHYMDMRASGPLPGDFPGVNAQNSDPLKKFPRMIHMHRWDDQSLQWMLDARINRCLTTLLGQEPFAVVNCFSPCAWLAPYMWVRAGGRKFRDFHPARLAAVK